jgi:hypothetical protein
MESQPTHQHSKNKERAQGEKLGTGQKKFELPYGTCALKSYRVLPFFTTAY